MSIKVLLVEDSPVAMTMLKRILNSSGEVVIVGTANNGLEALELIPKAHPDVICTDLHMPKMNGLELTSEVMARYPTPILVISVSVLEKDTHHVFNLLQAGAVDIFPKPDSGQLKDYELLKDKLINKIKVLSGVTVFTKLRQYNTSPTVPKPIPTFTASTSPIKIVAIGTSTGGPNALLDIFKQLPANFPVPIVCVQHISEGFLQGLIDWLDSNCRIKVKIAQPGEYPQPGTVYFPPDQHHLELDSNGCCLCSQSPPVDGHRPSVNVTFKSVARVYGREALAILLTGMGQDGATGLQAIALTGGKTIAQDEGRCVVFGMPKAAIDLGAAQKVLSLAAISLELRNIT